MGAELFFALGDQTRLKIVDELAESGEMRVTDIASEFELSRQAVTRHINLLCNAGLLNDRRMGRERYLSLRPNALDPVRAWLGRYDAFWTNRLEGLKTLIEESDG